MLVKYQMMRKNVSLEKFGLKFPALTIKRKIYKGNIDHNDSLDKKM